MPKKIDTSVDSEQAKDERETRRQDDRLLGQLEENCEKLNFIIDIAYHLFKNQLSVDRIEQTVGMLITATEQHRKVALTIHNIRHPKSTVTNLAQCPLAPGGLDRLASLTQFFYQFSYFQSLTLNLRGFKYGGAVGDWFGGWQIFRGGSNGGDCDRLVARLRDRVSSSDYPIAQNFFSSSLTAWI